jgi:predicted P-loop ATPase
VSATKAFLSSSVDALRPPYHRDIEDFPRASIICGSTNKNEFLSDETGNRRFWVVPVQKKIDVALLTQERDAIWAAAVAAYKSGEQWWLTPEEDAFLAQANQTWQTTDSWEEAILNHLQDKPTCTISDLLTKAIGLELSKQSKGEQMRVSNILRRNGWIRVQKQIDNKRQRYWEKVEQEVEQPLNSLPISVSKESKKKVEQQVEQHLNPLPVKALESTAPPAPPVSLNFSKNQENTTLDEHTADLTNAISENPKRFEVRGGAGGAAQIKTSETPTVQGLQPAPPTAPPAAPPPCSLKVEQQVGQ